MAFVSDIFIVFMIILWVFVSVGIVIKYVICRCLKRLEIRWPGSLVSWTAPFSPRCLYDDSSEGPVYLSSKQFKTSEHSSAPRQHIHYFYLNFVFITVSFTSGDMLHVTCPSCLDILSSSSNLGVWHSRDSSKLER